jgi:hypothetical protein
MHIVNWREKKVEISQWWQFGYLIIDYNENWTTQIYVNLN